MFLAGCRDKNDSTIIMKVKYFVHDTVRVQDIVKMGDYLKVAVEADGVDDSRVSKLITVYFNTQKRFTENRRINYLKHYNDIDSNYGIDVFYFTDNVTVCSTVKYVTNGNGDSLTSCKTFTIKK